jgi:hypothetical protein
VDDAFDRRVYHNCHVVEASGAGDVFQAGQAGAIGPGAKASNTNFGSVLREAIGGVSLGQLVAELEAVRLAMLKDATTPEQDQAIANVAAAEDAAKKGDAKGFRSGGRRGLAGGPSRPRRRGRAAAGSQREKLVRGSWAGLRPCACRAALRTKPASPSRVAGACTNGRRPTPRTTPDTVMARRPASTSPATASPP